MTTQSSTSRFADRIFKGMGMTSWIGLFVPPDGTVADLMPPRDLRETLRAD